MIKQEQKRLMEGLVNHLDNNTTIDGGGIIKNPVDTYTSEKRFNLEWETFFKDHPQIIGMTGDLAEPNSFVTIEDFGSSIIAARDPKGKFRAYANACSHRGAQIEHEKKGVKSKFTCPYHAWTFNNEGNLIGYPKRDHFGTIDKDCYPLTELPSLEHNGFLWVHPNPKGEINIDELFGDKLNAEFDSWNFDKLILSHDDEYVVDMNWKLMIDTFGETYHFSFVHQDTLFPGIYGNCQMFDMFKRNARSIIARREIDELRKIPKEEWKITGELMHAPDEWHITNASLPIYFLFPNIIFIPTKDGAFLVKVYPLDNSVHKSVSKIQFYFYPEAMEVANSMDVDLKTLFTLFGDVIRDEDYVVAASSYKGIKSGNIDYLTFGRNEQPLHHYHNTYREALGMKKLKLIEA